MSDGFADILTPEQTMSLFGIAFAENLRAILNVPKGMLSRQGFDEMADNNPATHLGIPVLFSDIMHQKGLTDIDMSPLARVVQISKDYLDGRPVDLRQCEELEKLCDHDNRTLWQPMIDQLEQAKFPGMHHKSLLSMVTAFTGAKLVISYVALVQGDKTGKAEIMRPIYKDMVLGKLGF